jgi:excisionase family DNA binding protein
MSSTRTLHRERPDVSGRSANELVSLKPLAVPVKTARALLGIGNTKFYELVNDRTIETISLGRRRLVIYASLERLVATGGGRKRE